MAFGDLIKFDHNPVNASATQTADLGSNPASNNLLIFANCVRQNTVAISTAPSGFTLLHSNLAGDQSLAWYYKVSAGSEQTASLVWDANTHGASCYAEYDWDGLTPTIVKNEDVTNITSDTNSQPSGAATPDTSTNICIALHCTDLGNDNFTGQAVDGSWIEDILFESGHTSGDCKLSRLVSVTGSQEATHSDTDVGQTMYGAIATFSTAGGDPVVEIPTLYSIIQFNRRKR